MVTRCRRQRKKEKKQAIHDLVGIWNTVITSTVKQTEVEVRSGGDRGGGGGQGRAVDVLCMAWEVGKRVEEETKEHHHHRRR